MLASAQSLVDEHRIKSETLIDQSQKEQHTIDRHMATPKLDRGRGKCHLYNSGNRLVLSLGVVIH